MISHEDSLRDQKLNWLFASQGLLVAGLGLSWGKPGSLFLILGIATIGLLFCVSIGASLHSSTFAIRSLADQGKARYVQGYDGPRVVALRSGQVVPRWITKVYPWNILPAALAAFWVVTRLKVISEH
jgi:hypothetical protein